MTTRTIGTTVGSGLMARSAAIVLSLLMAGCAMAPLDRAGSLQAYDDLQPSNGLVTRSLLKVDKDEVLAAKTVRILPAAFSESAGDTPFTPAQRKLVTNA